MKIRPAVKNDLPIVINIVQACIRDMESRGIYQWDDIYPDPSTLQKDIELSQMWVMEDRDTLCGMMVLNEQESPEYEQVQWKYQGKILVVHRLAIDPSYQGRHLATQLMEFAECWGNEKRYDAIRLDAFIENPGAVRLYQKLKYWNAGIVKFRKGLFYVFEKPLQNQIYPPGS